MTSLHMICDMPPQSKILATPMIVTAQKSIIRKKKPLNNAYEQRIAKMNNE